MHLLQGPRRLCIVALGPLLLSPTNSFQLPNNWSKLTSVSLTTSTGGQAACASGYISVDITSTNQKFTLQPPANQFVATELTQELLQSDSTLVPSKTAGNTTISGTYKIAAALCYPTDPSISVQTVQVLTHGVGLDKSYWDIAPTYSYVDASAEAGYATLAYDRLGTGSSDHPDGINVVQSALEIEILHVLTQDLRAIFKNVVCTSHSFGSIIQVGHDAKYPDDCDAVIATGISDTIQYLASTQLSNNPAIASEVNPLKYGALSSAYLTDPTPISFQQPFFRYPFFDTSIFDTQYHHTSTYTIGELFTLPLAYVPAPQYSKPVDIVLGQYDFTFCLGDCSEPNRADAFKSAFYSGANSKSQTYLVPNSGHLINDHYSAGLAYKQMTDFLKSIGF